MVRQLGPGSIIFAAIIGSGELILTTNLGSEVGFTLLRFVLFGCVIKVLLQKEMGRQAIVRGRSTIQALNVMSVPRWLVSWLVWIWVVMFICAFFQMAINVAAPTCGTNDDGAVFERRKRKAPPCDKAGP